MSTGESEEEEASEGVGDSSHRSSDSIHRSRDSVDAGRPRDRSSSLRPAFSQPPTAGGGGGSGGLPTVEAVNQVGFNVRYIYLSFYSPLKYLSTNKNLYVFEYLPYHRLSITI